MLIEFFGLPGAGKSTMSRLAADLLLKRGLVVDEVTYNLDHRRSGLERQLAKLGRCVRYAAAHPRHALSDLVRIAATRQATLIDFGKSIFNWMYIASLASRRRSSGRIAFLDQGVAQAMWSICFAALHGKALDLLLGDRQLGALWPDLIIHVQADFQTIGHRLANRQRRVSRLDALGQDHQALLSAEAYVDAIIRRLKAAGIPVIEVENSDPGQLASAARLIANSITTMLNEQMAASGAVLAPYTAACCARGIPGRSHPARSPSDSPPVFAVNGAQGDMMTTQPGPRHDGSRA
jgi:hypothetical protein